MSLNSLLLSLSVKLVQVHKRKLKSKPKLLPTSDDLGQIYTFVILNIWLFVLIIWLFLFIISLLMAE